MGGNVFTEYLSTKEPEFVGRRLQTDDYHSAMYAVQSILKSIGLEYAVIDFVREKQSHGDLDIIVHKGVLSAFEVTNILRSKKIIVSQTSTDSLSFLLLTFQIDLIFIDPDSVEYARNYYSWNDLGNLIGRTSKQLGLKHGHDGLYFVQRDGDRVLKEYKLSTDYNVVLKLLQLDVEHFNKGFDTYYEMFKWVTSSPYFNPSKFLFENLNNRNRVRDRKRAIYNMFLIWSGSQSFNTPIVIEDRDQFVLNNFPEIKEEYYRQIEKVEQSKLLYEKFNGNLLSDWLNLEGKDLGNFIAQFKCHYDNQTLLNYSAEAIKNLVESFYKDNYIATSRKCSN